jgi:hypothetical protein
LFEEKKDRWKVADKEVVVVVEDILHSCYLT